MKSMSFPMRLNNLGGISTVDTNMVAHVNESITQILTTSKGERLMNPDYGCSVDLKVFAPNNAQVTREEDFRYIDEALYRIYVAEVLECIHKFENRVEVLGESIKVKYSDSVLILKLNYILKIDGTTQEYTLQL